MKDLISFLHCKSCFDSKEKSEKLQIAVHEWEEDRFALHVVCLTCNSEVAVIIDIQSFGKRTHTEGRQVH